MTRYVFEEVRKALSDQWGFSIHRTSHDPSDGDHDGRWAVGYSRTGYVVSGNMPGIGHSHRRFRSLSDVVRVCKLDKVLTRSER